MNSPFTSQPSQHARATLAGLLGITAFSVLLLCGAGPVPVQNFRPQGAMQSDLDAGGHNLTNAATVSAANLIVTGTLTAPAGFTLPFSAIGNPPTTLAGYGITDPVITALGPNLSAVAGISSGTLDLTSALGTAAFQSTGAFDSAGAATTAIGTAEAFSSNANNLTSGTLGMTLFNNGTSADTNHFWRGDATWAHIAPSGFQVLAAASGDITTATFVGATVAPSSGTTTVTITPYTGTGVISVSGSNVISYTGTTSSGVTSFSSGTLSPLFTTTVANSTSTPALSFSLGNAAANTIFGNATGSSGAPAYNAASSYTGTSSSTFAAGNDSRITGAVQNSALGSGVATALGVTPNNPGALNQNVIPPGSVFICFGDSVTMGYPVVAGSGGGSSGHAASYTGPGMTWCQYLSSLPQFYNIPVYEYGVGGAQSGQFLTDSTGTSTLAGTEYKNGALVGSYGGITAQPSTLYPSSSGAVAYLVEQYANNDAGAALSPTTYLSNLQTAWSNLKAAGTGTNVKIVATTGVCGSTGNNGINEAYLGEYANNVRNSPQSWDYLADTALLFQSVPINALTAGSATATDWYSDNLHPNQYGYKAFAQCVAQAVLNPASRLTTLWQGDEYLNQKRIYFFNSLESYNTFASVGWGPDANAVEICTTYGSPIVFGSHNGSTLTQTGQFYATGGLALGSSPADPGLGGLFATGNIEIDTAGKGLQVKEGSNAKQGTATLTAGTVTVGDTAVTSTSRVLLTVQSPGGTVGTPYISARTAGTSFTISSTSSSDTSTVAYEIFEPAP